MPSTAKARLKTFINKAFELSDCLYFIYLGSCFRRLMSRLDEREAGKLHKRRLKTSWLPNVICEEMKSAVNFRRSLRRLCTCEKEKEMRVPFTELCYYLLPRFLKCQLVPEN